MVQRTSAAGISQQGRSATGVRVMNLKDDDIVSAVALVVDPGEDSDPRPSRLRTLRRLTATPSNPLTVLLTVHIRAPALR